MHGPQRPPGFWAAHPFQVLKRDEVFWRGRYLTERPVPGGSWLGADITIDLSSLTFTEQVQFALGRLRASRSLKEQP